MRLLTILQLAWKLLKSETTFGTREGTRDFLRKLIATAKIATDRTENKIDDALIAKLERIIESDELFNFCYGLLEAVFEKEPDKGTENEDGTDGDESKNEEGGDEANGLVASEGVA